MNNARLPIIRRISHSNNLLPNFLKPLTFTLLLSACSLSPDFKLPETPVPDAFKEQTAEAPVPEGSWQPAVSLEKENRGEWWKLFGDEALNLLEAQAAQANPSLVAAGARVAQARAAIRTSAPSFLPDIDIGANVARSKPARAQLAAFGSSNNNVNLKPYTLYSAGSTLTYEADLFGKVRDTYKALSLDADAQAAAYRSVLLALQADVAQNYFALREADSERLLLRNTVTIREEAARIMNRRFEVGDVGGLEQSRTQSELASARADLIALERQRTTLEHALAALLGKLPSEFTVAEAQLNDAPPVIPSGLPSSLLQRRPDIAAAEATMAAANTRIGVARTAFFPNLILTASGGFESLSLGDLFNWSNRTWALGQLAGTALSLSVFDNGRNAARLDIAKESYKEALGNYQTQVIDAFRDVEDALAGQRLLAQQAVQQDAAAKAAADTTRLTQMRYNEGEIDYFQVVDDERNSLALQRLALQTRGQRFAASVALIRALGGGWDEVKK